MPEQDLQSLRSMALFYGGGTGGEHGAVNWSRIEEELREGSLPLTPKGHIAVLIDLANGRKVSGQKWNQFVGARIQKGLDDEQVELPPRALKFVQHNMSMVAEGTTKARDDAARVIAEEITGRVVIAPTWSAERGRQDRVIAKDTPSAIAYGLWLLTDKQSPLAGTLCRCRYSKCRKFFLKRPGKGGRGRHRRRYCCAKHEKFGDREQARERMRRARA